MKAAGIIAEYNPFHNGHRFHVEKTRDITGADVIIAVMSGNFVQRGHPALYNKWIRAECAVRGGVDLVLELPYIFSCNSAEFFAKGSIGILNLLGGVDFLSFGAEEGNLVALQEATKILVEEEETVLKLAKENLMNGMSFAKARSEALKIIAGEETSSLLEKPNNILGIEYLKQLKRRKSNLVPIAVKREGPGYHDMEQDGNFVSASAIRAGLQEGKEIDAFSKSLPQTTVSRLEKRKPVFSQDMISYLIYQISVMNEAELSEILSVNEGLENKVKKAAKSALDYEDLIEKIKSKRYPRTRIERMCCHILCKVSKAEYALLEAEDCWYTNILASNEKGREFLRWIKKDKLSKILVCANPSKEIDKKQGLSDMLRIGNRCDKVYDLLSAEPVIERKPFILED